MTHFRRVTAAAAAGALAFSLACGHEAPPSSRQPGFAPRLGTMPPAIAEKCRRDKALRRACPVKVPIVKPGAFQHVTAPRRIWPVFSAEWNAPYPKLTERNAPPRSVHLVVHAEHRHMFPFRWPTKLHPQDSPIEDKRKEALLVDTPTWGGLRGSLVLAPSYPFGGIDGDHLVFRWEEEGSTYAVSLHAWRPLDESIATLKAVVESLP